ncbi:MAG: hypothetical protein IKW38_00530 [Kiritimatiellae bacterium]|nr:hypothetical protein [Kiritimatiellia bacterium]
MKPFSSSDNRGSALLIVLGLLSFLMISAVAFSISMRTERTAAASYRRGLLARELLDNAFVDARMAVETTLRVQTTYAGGFDARNASTRTVECLAPFRNQNDDRYGRVLTSFEASSYGSTANLLDEAVMRHVPPYVAHAVYSYLEEGSSIGNGEGENSGSLAYGSAIDTVATWKRITAHIPELDNSNDDIDEAVKQETVIGRMAWAVVNLSDSLDINALGSASQYRGIGLTANDFAFGTAATGSTAPRDIYDLVETANSSEGSEIADLPVFCSNADIARYTERISGSTPLVVDNGNEFPYSWQDAVANDGEGFYSPFSCYSFWPNADRKGEGAADRRSAGSDALATISCDEVKQESIRDTGAALASEIQSLAGNASYLGNDDAALNLVRMLVDYIDNDSEPNHFDTSTVKEIYSNALPTVENVPMVSEVGYDASAWKDSQTENDLKEMVEDALKGVNTASFGTVTKAQDIKTNLEDAELKFKVPVAKLDLALRAYFPGFEKAEDSYDVTPVGFVGLCAAGDVGGAAVETEGEAVATAEMKVGGSTLTVNNGSDVFTGVTGGITCEAKGDLEVTFKGDKIPVTYEMPSEITNPGVTPPVRQNTTFSFLVDYLFRVDVTSGNAVVDRVPADQGVTERGKEDYPANLNDRLGESKMRRLDAQYFRVSCPVTVSFMPEWELEADVNPNDNSVEIKYKKLKVFEDQIDVAIDFNAELKVGGLTLRPSSEESAKSYQALSPERGTWFTVDPRYNWLSPMLGLKSASASGYGTSQAIRQNLSSPHWLFTENESVPSGSDASNVQQDYATANDNVVPFSWGLTVEDIRYGHNDSGQLLLPGEVGFLPVPLSTSTWHPNEAYNSNTIASYYEDVAKASFFRTVPVADLKDGALDYDRYTRLANLFGSFAGENFPEEHRGLVNVFAAQDDYYLAQQLRQFAMLGIPASIKQAAKVTFDRLKAAESVKRASSEMVADLASTIGQVDLDKLEPPKYDEFVTDYLFPLPKGSRREGRDWNKEQELFKGGPKAVPQRPKTLDFIVQDGIAGASFADRLAAYNDEKGAGDKLGQNDMTTLLSVAKECFGDRQQLFLYILRADAIAYVSGRDLANFRPLSTARAVALVWRDAYGELPDRVIYYQVLP